MSFKQFLQEREGTFSYCSSQVTFTPEDNQHILKAQKYISDNSLVDYGRDLDVHCTIRYGIDVLNFERLKINLKGFQQFPCVVETVDYFDCPEYDVVKFKVTLNPQLAQLRSTVEQTQMCNKSQYDYSPHITIAYVKKGLGEFYSKILKEHFSAAFIVTATKFEACNRDGSVQVIELC